MSNLSDRAGRCAAWASAAALSAVMFGAAPAMAFERDGQITVNGGLCLDAHAPDAGRNGGRVQVWTCNGSPQQRWRFDSSTGQLRNSVAGLCLDVHAPDLENNGGRVQVWTCNNSPQQRWMLDEARNSLLVSSGRCLDAHAPDMNTNGGRVQIWACNNSPQQTWRFGAPAGGGAPGGSGQPDLTPIVAASASASISSGVMVGVEINNRGDAAAPGSRPGSSGYMVDVILSTDNTTPPGFATYSPNFSEDVLLRGGRFSNTPNIPAGDTHRFGAPSYDTGPYQIPADTRPGAYYICLRVDPENVVAESREDNNSVCQAITLTP